MNPIAPAGKPALVRVEGPHDRGGMQQALDLGAAGLMVPTVNTGGRGRRWRVVLPASPESCCPARCSPCSGALRLLLARLYYAQCCLPVGRALHVALCCLRYRCPFERYCSC